MRIRYLLSSAVAAALVTFLGLGSLSTAVAADKKTELAKVNSAYAALDDYLYANKANSKPEEAAKLCAALATEVRAVVAKKDLPAAYREEAYRFLLNAYSGIIILDEPRFAPIFSELVTEVKKEFPGGKGAAYGDFTILEIELAVAQDLPAFARKLVNYGKTYPKFSDYTEQVVLHFLQRVAAQNPNEALKLAQDMRSELGTLTRLEPLIAEIKRIGTAATLSATTIDGKKLSLADFSGRVVVVDFWLTSCGPCVKMTPQLTALVKKYGADKIAVVGVSADESRQDVVDYVKKHTVAWQQIHPDDEVARAALLEKFGVSGFPSLIVIDGQGKFASILLTEMKSVEQIVSGLLD